MLLPGVADVETLRYFSSLIGDTDVREVTHSRGRDGRSTSTGRRRVPLLAPDAMRQIADGQALLLYGRLPPVRIRLRRYFDNRRLLALSQPTSPRKDVQMGIDDEILGDPYGEGDVDDDLIADHRALSWRQLQRTDARRDWWAVLWDDVCRLRARYRLSVRSRWWEDEIQVEALAALSAWVSGMTAAIGRIPPGN